MKKKTKLMNKYLFNNMHLNYLDWIDLIITLIDLIYYNFEDYLKINKKINKKN